MSDASLLGTRLGKYRVVSLLGQGGMGAVYAGEDTRLKRPVAIKILSEALTRHPESLQRFLLEARAAARLNHPNVVAVHDVGRHGGVCYIVMELVRGGSAQGRIGERRPLPWAEATRIVADVCRGLGAAHAAGLIHRDIKPGNVLLAADGTAKLADFGLAKAPMLLSSRLTRDGTIVGTLHYMSPEQCTNDRLDSRTDLYALGATYYALLVGRPPFDGPGDVQILYAHCSSPVPDPRDSVSSLPAGCAAVVARAMAKKRGERFQSAGEMLVALTALTPTPVAIPLAAPAAETVVSPAAPAVVLTPVVRAAKSPRIRRAPILAGLGVAALGAVVVTAVLSYPRMAAVSSPRGTETAAQPGRPAPMIALRARPPLPVRHKGDVTSVSLGAGRLASAGGDGNVVISRLDGSESHVTHYNGRLAATALTPDGKLLAAGGDARSVFLRDVEQNEGLPTLGDFPGEITSLAFSPSGKELAVGTATTLDLVEWPPPAPLRPRRRLLQMQYMVSSVAFAADGKRLAACTYGKTAYLWDLDTLNRRTATGDFPDEFATVALAPDGSRVAFASRTTGVYLWEPDADRPARLADAQPGLALVAFAPGGRALVSGGVWGGPLKVHDLTTGKTTLVPAIASGRVTALRFAPDGKVFAAACSDGTVRLWDAIAADEADR